MLTFCKCRALPDTLNRTSKAMAARIGRSIGIDVKQILLAMRITAAILLILSLHVTANGVSQTITLSGKDIPLKNVFAEIKKQSGYLIVSNKDIVDDATPVSIDVQDYPLLKFLDETLAPQGLGYVIENRTIFLKKLNEKSFVEKIIQALTPPIDVKGRVVDENGEPVEGATVTVKGTNIATSTNANGEFQFKAIPDESTLIVSGVNVETRELKIRGNTSVMISTVVKATNLNEVVVNKGYYTEKQRYSVANIGHISKDEIEKQPVRNPLLALQGRVPGIEVTQLTGVNGGGVKVRIQGQNSIANGSEPLIVIDGVPYDSKFAIVNGFRDIMQGSSPLNFINPNDIESIDVLKDADATSIYGSRAANGAILITTKKGKIGKTKLSVNFRQGWGKVTRHVDMMNTRQYLDMRYEAYKNDGIDLNTEPISNKNYDLTVWDTTRYTDWQKTLIGGTAQYTNINAGISGGTATMQYLIGGSWNRATTVFPGNFDDKSGGLHFSVNGVTPNQKFNIQLSGSYNVDDNHLPGIDLTQRAILLAPDAPSLYNADGSINWAQNAAGTSTWANSLAYTQGYDNTNNSSSFVSNATLTYHVLPGLDILSTLGYNRLQSQSWVPFRIEANSPESRPVATRFAGFGTNNSANLIAEPQITYHGKVGDGRLEALIGSTLLKKNLDNFTGNGYGYTNDLVMKNLSSAPTVTVTTNALTYKYNALFGRLGYNLNDKYLINLTGRRDGSSRFGDNNKFNNFWSIAGGWIFSQENLVQRTIPFLSFGKLRASYGTTGNDQIADYSYLSLYAFATGGIPYQTGSSLYAYGIGNPNLEWEETRKFQGGIDLGFFDDRIIINATYVKNRSSNQLIGYSIPTTTGFTSIIRNFPATVQNTSWELALQSTIVKIKNFSWVSNANLTIPRNKLVSFPGIEKTPYYNPTSGVAVGEPLGVLTTMFHYGEVDPASGIYLAADKDRKVIPDPGFANYPDDYVVHLNANSVFYGGFQNSVTYKGFQLDILFQFTRKLGAKDLLYGNGSKYPGQVSDEMSNQPARIVGKQWRQKGDVSQIARYNTDGSLYDYNVTGSEEFYSLRLHISG